MRCAVCYQPCDVPLALEDGTLLGMACPDECQALLWMSHFLQVCPDSDAEYAEHERVLLRWQWRKCRAEKARQPFDQPAPQSPAERNTTLLHILFRS